ncbi:MAG TPA: A/G-specific adenine glycosylase [Verrucomicrobiae bacterium]|nr:A/G-specific adenine glycosylase [Verrucomicrobiae bacterium]
MTGSNPQSAILAALKRSENGRTPHLKRLVPALLHWFAANARDLPWRRTRDPYAIWVSEIMLQQTQVKTVIPYWERWMRELPTLKAVAHASPDKIHKLWEGLGYYTRARNLHKAAKQIVARQDAITRSSRRRGNETHIKRKLETPHVVSYTFPENFADVLALPGIGRYTAGAICSIAFNQPTPILDGNVIRVLTRIFGIAENPKEKETNARLWKLTAKLVACAVNYQTSRSSRREEAHSGIRTGQSLLTSAATPAGNCSALNQSLMELGALICTPRNTQCKICPVKKLCVAFRENRIAELPNLDKRAATTARGFVAFVVGQSGRFLLRQRPAGVVNAHLWEFPNVEILNGESDPKLAAESILGIKPSSIKPLCIVKHSITRYRITLEAFHADFAGTSYTRPCSGPAKSGTRVIRFSEVGIWKTPAQMRELAFSSAHKKLASAAFKCILSSR